MKEGFFMILRMANKYDIDSLAEMRWEHECENEENFVFSKEKFSEAFSKFLSNSLNINWVVWVAEENGKIISNIFIQRIRKVPKPQKLFAEIGYVTNVHTKSTHRNIGIGTQLLKKVKEWAFENKIELLFLWPSEKSINYYEREGFRTTNDFLELELE